MLELGVMVKCHIAINVTIFLDNNQHNDKDIFDGQLLYISVRAPDLNIFSAK